MNARPAGMFVLALIASLFLGTAQAENQVRIVRLSYTNGQVQIDKGQGAGYEQALPNMPVVEGLKIATGSDGVAELEFEDGSTFRIIPETEIEVRQLELEDSGATLSTIALLHGTAYVDFRKHKDDVFNLVLPQHDLALSHAVRLRAEVAQDEADLAVFSGELDVPGSDHLVRVKKNETLTFNFANAYEYSLAKEIEPAPYDDWSNEREKYRERYASMVDSSGGAPVNGLADLAYYGTSYDLPGYGWVWQPYGIGYGWTPFSSGYWNYFPATGWIWCSYAPWGWYPYRYGSWIFAPSYGWVWSPGTGISVVSWHPVPPIQSAPPGFHPPARPIRPPVSPATSIVAVGEPPLRGPGHKLYAPDDPVLAIHASGNRGVKPAAGNAPVGGGVSTFAPATGPSIPASASPDHATARPLRPAGIPATVQDMRRAVNTPQNKSELGVMTHDDTYNRHLHTEMEHRAQPYAVAPAQGMAVAPAGTPAPHHEQAIQPRTAPGQSSPSWHGGSGPAAHTEAAPHSEPSGGFSGGGTAMHSGGGAPGAGGGGGGHAGGGRPPR